MVTLREFLVKPFGPWQDSEVLAQGFKSTKTRLKYLTDVRLVCNGRFIGFALMSLRGYPSC